jgi:hypothetical protein
MVGAPNLPEFAWQLACGHRRFGATRTRRDLPGMKKAGTNPAFD